MFCKIEIFTLVPCDAVYSFKYRLIFLAFQKITRRVTFFEKTMSLVNNNLFYQKCISDFSKPLFRQGIISINDLKDNTPLTGRVTNVTTFGAFVDIGVSHNGLLHTSAIPSYKKLGVGDIVNVVCSKVDKKSNRIQLRLRYV